MYKLWMSIYKEVLLLKRDAGGLVILFVMPLVLIITITLIQDSTFKTATETKIPILLVDNDKGEVSELIKKNLGESNSFEVITSQGGKSIDEAFAKEKVFDGDYQLAIIIPEKLSEGLKEKVEENVTSIMQGVMEEDTVAVEPSVKKEAPKEVRLYFDPASQTAFKTAVKSTIDKMISQIETKTIYNAFTEQLGEESVAAFNQESYISFKEIVPMFDNKEMVPNSTQHNVPAWTLFAIFFIVVPLSINIVKEKSQGTNVRLRTNPVSYATVIGGKTITYLIICMLQFYLMLAVGMYVFPKIGLSPLELDGTFALMSVVALFSGLAAVGFGILLGTVAKTQEQSAPFGATSVVILAAIGGVWVPVFAMPKIMQHIAKISPMNWGLEAFYDVLLRKYTIIGILPYLGLLLLFFLIMTAVSIFYDEKKRAV
ncbi:ABC transporter permease [Flavobacterium beibuense]|uniref:ABC-2 type transporter, permease component n=1 Tax=Flavobacterium beibuense TaxID=657326 RepID=A0A444WD48_9FLAO|nr:ABC transporter permease [Flavobacterium beibuense]RYJ43753.1 ABC-2 type transporter, permease component [Flavobacterium beibuense]